MDEVINSTKQIDDESDSFWNTNNDPNTTNNEEKENENNKTKSGVNTEADEYILETTAHPYPSSPHSSTIDTKLSIPMDHHKRILELQMLPKRIIELQKEINQYKIQINTEKEQSISVTTYWKQKTSEISTKNQDLVGRLEVHYIAIFPYFFVYKMVFCLFLERIWKEWWIHYLVIMIIC